MENYVFTFKQKVIWDSGFGYDIGLFVSINNPDEHCDTYHIKMR